MIAVVPGYISRSVAGSYDNEGMHLIWITMWLKENITKTIINKFPLCSFTQVLLSSACYWPTTCGLRLSKQGQCTGRPYAHWPTFTWWGDLMKCMNFWINKVFCLFVCFFKGLNEVFLYFQVSSWGGYVFLINLIPLHVLVLMLTGRFSHRIYVAYCTVYCLGTILSMQISFVGFQVSEQAPVLCYTVVVLRHTKHFQENCPAGKKYIACWWKYYPK